MHREREAVDATWSSCMDYVAICPHDHMFNVLFSYACLPVEDIL